MQADQRVWLVSDSSMIMSNFKPKPHKRAVLGHFNLLLTECCLLITFVNRLDPGQARQYVGPDLDPICLTLRWYS